MIFSPDSTWYLVAALNMSRGEGYVDASHAPITNRPPLFPILISLTMKASGLEGLTAAIIVVRGFGVLLLLTVFLIGYRLGGIVCGGLATWFIVTSRVFNQWASYLLSDIVIPFFILMGCWLLFQGIEKRRAYLCALGGVGMASAFWIKEMAVVYVILPFIFIMMRRSWPEGTHLRGCAWFLLILVSAILLWVSFAFTLEAPEASVIGYEAPKAMRVMAYGASVYFKKALNNLDELLWDAFSWPHIFLGSWIGTLVLAIRKERGGRFLIGVFVPFLPVLFHVGFAHLRRGNLMLFYILTSLSIAYLASRLLGFLRRRQRVYYLAMISVIFLAFFAHKRDVRVWKKRYSNPLGLKEVKYKWWFAPRIYKVHRWLDGSLPPGEGLLCTCKYLNSLFYLWDGERNVYMLPMLVGPLGPQAIDSGMRHLPGKGSPIFMWGHGTRDALFAIDQGDILRVMRERRLNYVLLTPPYHFLRIYFESHPSFELIGSWPKRSPAWFLFRRVGSLKPIPFRMLVDISAVRLAERLRYTYPEVYRKEVVGFLVNRVGLDKKIAKDVLFKTKYVAFFKKGIVSKLIKQRLKID